MFKSFFTVLIAVTFVFALVEGAKPPAPKPPATGLPLCTSLTSPESGLITNNLNGYVLFAGSGYSFAGGTATTFLNGNIASFPTPSPLSSNPKVTLNGLEILNLTRTTIDRNDLVNAYNTGTWRAGRTAIAGDIGMGKTFTPGVYYSTSSISISANLTLDAKGDSNAVFLFIADSSLSTSPGARVNLVNGARDCHVFWIIGSSATININNDFVGTVNTLASISIAAGSKVTGHLFSRYAISIDSSTISLPSCSPSAALVPCEAPSVSQIECVETYDCGDSSAGLATFSAVLAVLALVFTF